jgi:poly-gamma-glutamate capsule biosynthesis protein CapA/YwtB (metallophosphatase superfamily)
MRGYFLICLMAGFLSLSAQDTTRLRLLFAGDIMQHDAQITSAFNPAKGTYEYENTFQWIKPWIESADLALGNLEFTLAGKPYKGYPQFSGPDELAFELKKVGFDVLVTANNHSADRYKKGIIRTIDMLDSARVMHTGTFKDSSSRHLNYPLILEKLGFKIALLNYTYGTNGIPVPSPTIVNPIDTTQLKVDFKKARDSAADAIIVMIHFGDEYQRSPNKFQKKIAALCFREGATMVIGSHPHVIQPLEFYPEKNQLVAWSLGNFISNQRPRYRNGGLMVRVDLQKISHDSLSVTRIINPTYDLAYVHVDKRKKFHLIPVRHPNVNSLLGQDSLSLATFQQFATDSRQWLTKYNHQISEATDSIVYTIQKKCFEHTDGWLVLPPLTGDTFLAHDGKFTCLCEGKFATEEEAAIILSLVKTTDPSLRAVVKPILSSAIDRRK